MGQLGRLLSYLRPYRGRVVLALGLSFGVAALTSISLSALIPILETLFEEGGLERFRESTRAVLGTVSPTFADGVVEAFLTNRMTTLTSLLAGVLILTVVKGGLRFLNGYLVGTVALAGSRDLSNELMRSLIRQPVLFFEREGVGNVASRFTADSDEVVRALKTFTGTVFREPLQFMFLLALALLISPVLTLAALVIFPAVGVLVRKTGRIAKRNAKQVLGHRSRLLTIVQETFFGIRVVQSFRAEDRLSGAFVDENSRLYDRNRRLVRVEAATSPAMEVLVVLGVGGALLLGGAMAIKGDLSAGRLVTLYVAVGALYEPVRKLASAVPRIQTGLAGATRIFAYLDRTPEIRDAPDAKALPALADSLRLEGVFLSYGGRAQALRGVDLEIRHGEWLAIAGPSGSGKSSLAGLLPRFFDPDEGRVLLDGADLRGATLDSLRRQVALVSQENVLLDDTVRANVAFAHPEATDAEVAEAARIARVDEFVDSLPEGWDTVVGERGAALSGGQRQRIAIARAVLTNPPVLVLDEATSQVDEEGSRRIFAALAENRRGRTTILITHRVETLAQFERIAVLSAGRIEAEGTHAHLVEKSPTFSELVRSAAAQRSPAP